MAEFDIITWLGNRVGYNIPEETVKDIVMERGLQDVTDFAELTTRDKDLLLADILFYLWSSPTETASYSRAHGDNSESYGSQKLTDKRNIYGLMMSLYRKWDDPMAELVQDSGGDVNWLE